MVVVSLLRCASNREVTAPNVGHHHDLQPFLLPNPGLVDAVAADYACSDPCQLVASIGGDLARFPEPYARSRIATALVWGGRRVRAKMLRCPPAL